jgi:hypothetical protein
VQADEEEENEEGKEGKAMSYDTQNRHLVGIDVSAKGRIVVAMPPRGSLTKEQALMFAAWLVTTADAAEGVALDHMALAHAVSEWRRLYTEDPTSGGIVARLDAMQGVTVQAPTFQTVHQARELAASVVGVALDGNDLAPFFERVAAVHGVVHDGSELERVLKEEGEPVKLRPPVKRIDVAPSTMAEAAHQAGVEGVFDDEPVEVPTDAGRRRTVPKP